MPINDITDPEAVRQAMSEYRSLGQDAFLERYGFGRSRGWLLIGDDGATYDAKAILGAAHGHQYPEDGPLPQSAFHGGLTTAKPLRKMGFVVQEPSGGVRNPVWSRDELILALDLYVRHRPTLPGPRHTDVVALSDLLNRIGRLQETTMNGVYRNPNGVAMKLQNFRRFDPDQEGRGLPGGGQGEKDVWEAFASVPSLLGGDGSGFRGRPENRRTECAALPSEPGEKHIKGVCLHI